MRWRWRNTRPAVSTSMRRIEVAWLVFHLEVLY